MFSGKKTIDQTDQEYIKSEVAYLDSILKVIINLDPKNNFTKTLKEKYQTFESIKNNLENAAKTPNSQRKQDLYIHQLEELKQIIITMAKLYSDACNERIKSKSLSALNPNAKPVKHKESVYQSKAKVDNTDLRLMGYFFQHLTGIDYDPSQTGMGYKAKEGQQVDPGRLCGLFGLHTAEGFNIQTFEQENLTLGGKKMNLEELDTKQLRQTFSDKLVVSKAFRPE